MASPVLELTRQGKVAWLTLNRPETLNALTEELVTMLADAVDRVANDPELRVVILRGSGGNFCSGLDLKSTLPKDLGKTQASEALARFQAVIQRIVSAPLPFVAAVEGAAVGFGADLALACDLRVLGESAYLQEKFVDIGLMPDGGGTYWLPLFMGLGRALELLMLGTRIDAELALSYGLANRVCADAEVARVAEALALELAAKAPLALRAIKRATRMSAHATLEAALAREQRGQSELLTSQDFAEGVRAWQERRPPDFRGR